MDSKKKIGEYYIIESESLGKGAYGKVYLGYHESNPSTMLAIKQINLSMIPDPYLEEFKKMIEKEINNLNVLDHPNILKFQDVKMTKNNLYIVTELCKEGDLGRFAGKLPINTVLSYFKQIIRGLIHAKEKKLIHRDIKPENILLQNSTVRLADFGFSRVVDDPNNRMRMTSQIGTPLYMAPEVFYGEEYSSKCDVWSCGVVLFQMIFGKPPWIAENALELFKIIKQDKVKFPEKIEEKVADLILKMLRIDQDKRLDLEGVLQHEALGETSMKRSKSLAKKEERKIPENRKSDANIKCMGEAKPISTKPPKYLLFLVSKAEFFNDLSSKILDSREKIGLSKDCRIQLMILFSKIAVISAKKAVTICEMKKKQLAEISEISISEVESDSLKVYRLKAEENFRRHLDYFHENTSTFKNRIKKFEGTFSENVISEDVSEMNKGFLTEYKRVFCQVLDELENKIEDFKDLDADENEEFFRMVIKLVKVYRGSKIDNKFRFSRKSNPYELYTLKIDQLQGKKAKKKALNKLTNVIG